VTDLPEVAEERIVNGFEPVAWDDVDTEQPVWVRGMHCGNPCAYGPYQVKHKAERVLSHEKGLLFPHPREDLLQRARIR
jgi:hypothetical protein